MKKLVLISILALGIQGCTNNSGSGNSPEDAGPQVQASKMKVVKAVCTKDGKVVLEDVSSYDSAKEKNPEKLYLNAEGTESVAVDNCTFTHYDQK